MTRRGQRKISIGVHYMNIQRHLAVYCEGKLPAGLWLDLDEAAGIYKMS